MTKKNIKAKATGDLKSRVTILEKRLSALEHLSKRFTRKKREYTDEERAKIRARLLAGQEAARKRKNDAEVKVTTTGKTATSTKKVVKAKTVPTPKQS